MMIIITDVDEVAEVPLDMDEVRQPEIIRPQTSGPCIHYGPNGCEVPREDGQCPHLDNASIVCPIKDVLGAAQTLKRITRMQEWTAEEDAAICDATTAAESIPLYRSAIPDSERSDTAIRMRWYRKVRPSLAKTRDSHPDFDGDVALVTQCEEPPEAEVAAAFDKENLTHHPWIGMRVRILGPRDLLNKTGVVHRYNSDPREMLVALDNSHDRVWLPLESLLLIGAGRRSP